jgi:hypothetical protein
LPLAPGDIVSVEDTPLTAVARAAADLVRFSIGGAWTIF